jgi:hypothetical protein
MTRHRAITPALIAACFAAAVHIPCAAQAGRSPTELASAAARGMSLPQSGRPSAQVAREAFDRLASLAGTWQGSSSAAGTREVVDDDLVFEYRITGGGSVLTEFANAGTGNEMLSVFYLDGQRLILQHYCSAGNQPRLELVHADSTTLRFDLAGGTGFDPATDGHIHSARFNIGPGERVESFWTWFDRGREDHTARRIAHRVR